MHPLEPFLEEPVHISFYIVGVCSMGVFVLQVLWLGGWIQDRYSIAEVMMDITGVYALITYHRVVRGRIADLKRS
jgi:hypothetical protein